MYRPQTDTRHKMVTLSLLMLMVCRVSFTNITDGKSYDISVTLLVLSKQVISIGRFVYSIVN